MPPRQPLRTKVRDFLLAQILDGGFAPGDPIRELDIASRLGVSQAPVREALRELVATGLVEYEPNRGSRVRTIRSEDLVQYYPVRAALEGIAGEQAAPYLAGDTASLDEQIALMLYATAANNIFAFAKASSAFHRAVVVAAHNRALLDAWQTLGIEVLTTVSLGTTATPLLEVAQEHIPIAQALHNGDAKQASSLLRNHHGEYGIRARRLTRRPRPSLTTRRTSNMNAII
jgi:DNA-binding GntR family transcriptional regulator